MPTHTRTPTAAETANGERQVFPALDLSSPEGSGGDYLTDYNGRQRKSDRALKAN